jgi:hypothetical protein
LGDNPVLTQLLKKEESIMKKKLMASFLLAMLLMFVSGMAAVVAADTTGTWYLDKDEHTAAGTNYYMWKDDTSYLGLEITSLTGSHIWLANEVALSAVTYSDPWEGRMYCRAKTLDQSQTGDSTSVGLSGNVWAAQTFTADKTGKLIVTLKLKKNGIPTGVLIVQIRNVIDGKPGEIIYEQMSLAQFNFTTELTDYDLPFSMVTVTSGTQYAIVLYNTGAFSTNTYIYSREPNNPYTDGAYCYSGDNGSTWEVSPEWALYPDLYFKTWIESADVTTSIGSFDPDTDSFTEAGNTVITIGGEMADNDFTITPAAAFVVPEGDYLAFRLTASGSGQVDNLNTDGASWITSQSTEPPPPADVLYGVNASDDGLSIIDPGSGEITFIAPLDPDPYVFVTPIAMAARSSDGTIFVWNNSNRTGPGPQDFINTGVLLTVDRCTGLAAIVGPAQPKGLELAALAFGPDGILYGLNFDLFTINTTTGEETLIGNHGGRRIAAADFDSSGILYGIELTSLNASQKLFIINPDTGSLEEVGTLTESATNDEILGVIGTIVFNANGNLIGSSFGGPEGDIIFDIDPSNGTVSNVRPLSADAPQGMGFAPPCTAVPTPVGQNISVQPIDPATGTAPVTITFDEVTGAGTTTLNIYGGGEPPPFGFKRGEPPIYYEITTTASYSGSIQVCIDYSDINFVNENALTLYHYENYEWVEVNELSLDTESNIICGTVYSLSAFAILEPEIPIDIRPFSRHNIIIPWKHGVIPVAILSTDDFYAPDDVDRDTLTFGRTGDEESKVLCLRRARDVNRDGLKDIVCFFRTGLTDFEVGDTQGVLKGLTQDGSEFQGDDAVLVKGKKKWSWWKKR